MRNFVNKETQHREIIMIYFVEWFKQPNFIYITVFRNLLAYTHKPNHLSK